MLITKNKIAIVDQVLVIIDSAQCLLKIANKITGTEDCKKLIHSVELLNESLDILLPLSDQHDPRN